MYMNNIEIFKNEELGSIRTVQIDTETWFVGKDVADALGYANSRDAIATHVLECEKNTVAIYDGNKGNPNQVVINESGMYSLIFGSKLESAKKFRVWVTSEVLPSIRKHGMYITDELLSNNELLEDRIRELQFDRELLEEKQEELEKENKILKKMKYACEYISYESKNESSYLPNLAKQIIKTYIGNNKGKDKLIQVTDEGYILNKREVYKEVSKIVMRKSDIHKLLTVMGVKADTRTIFVSDEILSDEYVYYGFNLCE